MYTDPSTKNHVHALWGGCNGRPRSGGVQLGTCHSCDALLDHCFVVCQAFCEFDTWKRGKRRVFFPVESLRPQIKMFLQQVRMLQGLCNGLGGGTLLSYVPLITGGLLAENLLDSYSQARITSGDVRSARCTRAHFVPRRHECRHVAPCCHIRIFGRARREAGSINACESCRLGTILHK